MNVVLCALGACVSALLAGCGGSGSNNPVPTVSSLSPATVVVGSGAQNLTVNGSNFISSSTATFNGASRTASLVSASQLTVALTAVDVATPGSYPVVVTNPAPGGGSSTAVNLAVAYGTPAVSSLSPASVLIGSGAQTLTINGSNFVSASTVTFNGVAHTPSFVSATQLTIALTATDVATAGNFAVVVTNPTPGGGSSTAVSFTVNYPVPTATALSPSSVVAGAAAQTLTVTGTNFIAQTTVTFAGAAVIPTIVNSTTLTIPLTAANLATIGTLQVVVSNPTPGGGTASALSLAVTGPVVVGYVFKGATSGATVTAYEVSSTGASGTAIGSSVTNSANSFSLTINTSWSGAVRLTASGGSYISEFDGSTIAGTSTVSALLDSVKTSVSGISLTPASEFVNSYATTLMAGGTAEAAAHATATTLIRGYLGLTSSAVLESLVPVYDQADITANPNAFTLGLCLGALIQEGETYAPLSPDNLIAALSADIGDGTWDGKLTGTSITLPNGVAGPVVMAAARALAKPETTASSPLSPTAGTTDVLLALGTYINTGTAITGPGITPASVATLETDVFAGIAGCSCTPTFAGLQASSSGAATTYSLEGHQYLIVAARTGGIVVIYITNPALSSPPINAWPSIYSKTFAYSPIGGVIAITGLSGHPQVLAYSYGSKQVSAFNLDTLITGNPATANPLDLTFNLNLKATSEVAFSGGNAYIAGGIPDSTRLGVWLDTADGYGFLSLASLTSSPTSVSLSPLYAVQDTTEKIAENVGGDIGNNQILGGNYYGIQLTELGGGASYYLPVANLSSLTGLTSGEIFDGNSIDGGYRVGILTSEDEPTVTFLNLATVTETANATLNELAAGTGGLVQLKLGSSGGYYGTGPLLSGSAVDKTSHLSLFMAGYSTDLAVAQVQNPAAGGTWTGLTDWSYYSITSSPELSSYGYATDPHMVAVVYNQSTGTPFGYLLDGGYGSSANGVVQVDLNNFLAMARKGTSGDAAHQPAADRGATKTSSGGLVMTEFKWTNPTSGIPLLQKVTQDEYPSQPMTSVVPQ